MTDSPSWISLNDADTCWQDEAAKSIGYFTTRPMRCVDQELISELKAMAISSGDNVRLSLHAGPEDPFHEMIIFQHGDQFYPPKKHVAKDKSFHMIEGEMAVFVYSDEGSIVDAQRLSPLGAPIYRVAKGVFHTDIPITDYVIHHESTLGPFLGDADRVFADWSPAPHDIVELAKYREEMLAHLEP